MICGHPIKGDPTRPCVMKPGHKRRGHRDAEQQRRHAGQMASYHHERFKNDPEYRERKNKAALAWIKKHYRDDPKYREARLVSSRKWKADPSNKHHLFASSQRRTLRRIEQRINEAT